MVLITIITGAYKPTYNWGAPHCTLTDQYSRTSKMSQVRHPAAHIAEEPAHAYGSNQAQEAPRVSAKVKNQASAAGRALAVHNIYAADGQTVSNC